MEKILKEGISVNIFEKNAYENVFVRPISSSFTELALERIMVVEPNSQSVVNEEVNVASV